jgi:DNA-binding Lrp family transcriptional regulator
MISIHNMPQIEKLDDLDYEIIHMLQDDPTLTHSAIAEKLKRSQPAIGARIKKLTETGLLSMQMGVDFKKVDELTLVRVDIETTKPAEIFELCECCPHVINAMRTSGEYNVSLFLASDSLKQIDNVVERHYRNKPYVKKAKIERFTNFAKTFVMPFNLRADTHGCGENDPCNKDPICRENRLKAGKRSPEEIIMALEQPETQVH